MIVDAGSPEHDGDCIEFPGWSGDEKARFLAEKGVTTLVCGAVSHDYEKVFLAHGIETVSFIAGPVERVLDAWKDGTLLHDAFSMPGCGCPRRRRCRRRRHGTSLDLNNKENTIL